MVKNDTKKNARDQNNNKTLAPTQNRLYSRKATHLVIPLNEAQRRSRVAGLTSSGKAYNREKLMIQIIKIFHGIGVKTIC